MLGTESLSLENPARPDEKDVATELTGISFKNVDKKGTPRREDA